MQNNVVANDSPRLWQSGAARTIAILSVFKAILSGYVFYNLMKTLVEALDRGIQFRTFANYLAFGMYIAFTLLALFMTLKGMGAVFTVSGSSGGAGIVYRMLGGIRFILVFFLLIWEGLIIYYIIKVFEFASELGVSFFDVIESSLSYDSGFFEFLLYTQIPAAIMLIGIFYVGNKRLAVIIVQGDMAGNTRMLKGTGALSLQAALLGLLTLGSVVYTYFSSGGIAAFLNYADDMLGTSLLDGLGGIIRTYLFLVGLITAEYFLVAVANKKLNRYKYGGSSDTGAWARARFKPFFAASGALALGAFAVVGIADLAALLGIVHYMEYEPETVEVLNCVVPFLVCTLLCFGLCAKPRNLLILLGTGGYLAYMFYSKTGIGADFSNLAVIDKVQLSIEGLFLALLALTALVSLFVCDMGGKERLPRMYNAFLLIIALSAGVIGLAQWLKALIETVRYASSSEEPFIEEYALKFLSQISILAAYAGLALSVGRNDDKLCT